MPRLRLVIKMNKPGPNDGDMTRAIFELLGLYTVIEITAAYIVFILFH